MSAFLNMGGYALYVWPAYGVTIVGLAGAVFLTLRFYRIAQARLAALESSRK